jgi:hypothetical protein
MFKLIKSELENKDSLSLLSDMHGEIDLMLGEQ